MRNAINGRQEGECSKGDNRSFRHEGPKKWKMDAENLSFLRWKILREERVPEAAVLLGSLLEPRAETKSMAGT